MKKKRKRWAEGHRALCKISRITRIYLLLILLGITQTYASVSFSQTTLFSFDFEGWRLEKVLEAIEENSEYNFVYSKSLIDLDRKVYVKVRNQPIKGVLKEVLEGTNIIFEVLDAQVILSPFVKENHGIDQDGIKKIKGKITDSKKKPLPGVTITILGTTKGVITDTDGSFSIDARATDKLVFSFIGMESQIVDVGNKTLIDIQMKEKVSELEDVTVVAFAKQKKESVIASVTSVKPEELKVSSSNLTTALAGRLSGIISYQSSGEPGRDDANFFVRGVTTFGYKKSPLILIDGVELTSADLARLQTDDIASFSIMKDATATALYGARGANGVILVTTKEGVEGKAKISVRFENSISSPTRDVDFADPITYMLLHNEAAKTRNPNQPLPYSYQKIDRTKNPDRNEYVYPANDWHSMLFKNSTNNQRLNFNVRGGGKIARYYFAASVTQDNGVLKVDKKNNFNNNIDLKKYLLRSNININLTKFTEAIVRFHGTFDDYTGPIDGGSGLYKKIVQSNPVLFPAYYEADQANEFTKHILFGNAGNIGDYINPYADMVKGYKDETRALMLAQFEVKQNLDFITQGLNVRFMANINRTSSYHVIRNYKPYYYNVGTYNIKDDIYTLTQLNPLQGSESLSYAEGEKKISSVTYMEGAVTYNREIKEKHHVSGLTVFTLRESKVANAGDLQASLPSRNLGVSGRFTYSYGRRYFGEFNFGYNGSERFSKAERFGFFPSMGVGWIVSNEEFWIPLKSTISKLKFKGTYGIVGNDAIGNPSERFFYLSNVNLNNNGNGYNFGTHFDYRRPGVSISRYANDQITWETAKKMNIGVEMDLFGKLAIQADWFSEYRTNILMSRADIPNTMGLQATMKANVGEASAGGFDMSMDFNHRFASGMWIASRLNFTYASSRYEVYEEPDYDALGAPWRKHVGHSLNQRWGYVAERLFVDEYDVENSPEQFGEYMAGDIKYKDINKDGKINEQDQVPIGFPTSPEIIYGFGSSMGYKGVDFSFFFQGLGRRSFWIDPRATAPFIDNIRGRVKGNNALLQVYADGAWLEERRDPYAIWPRLSDHIIRNNVVNSTWFMQNGAFLRLKSVELGYTIPHNLFRKYNINKFRVYVSGTNLLTISKFKLWDIEMGSNGLAYPIQKVFNVGVQVSF